MSSVQRGHEGEVFDRGGDGGSGELLVGAVEGDDAGAEHDDAGRDAAKEFAVVRDDDGGAGRVVSAGAVMAFPDEIDDVIADDRVEAGRGFVEERDDGIDGDGAGDRDALGHAAAEGFALFAGYGVDIKRDGLETVADARGDLLGREFGVLAEPERDVVEDGAGEEGVALEDDGPEEADGVEFFVVERREIDERRIGLGVVGDEHATEVGLDEAGEVIEQYRLAGAATADDCDDVAAVDGEGDAVEDGLIAEGFDEVFGEDFGCGDAAFWGIDCGRHAVEA